MEVGSGHVCRGQVLVHWAKKELGKIRRPILQFCLYTNLDHSLLTCQICGLEHMLFLSLLVLTVNEQGKEWERLGRRMKIMNAEHKNVEFYK